jgi:hypothetical protein
MDIKSRRLRSCLVVAMNLSLAGGCTLQDRDTSKLAAARLIATPASHYSTQKARYLGEKYKEHLNRLVERFIANPKTTNLQFANNIASAGGIGFFTHSAVKVPDDRFLEIVLGTVDRFEAKGDYSARVARLFSLYGKELLTILTSDVDMYNEKELSGYGLNFTWRTLGAQAGGERVIVYFSKEKVRAFLKQELDQNSLLADAVIFAMEQDGMANLVSFRAPEPPPDVRAPIHEQVLLPELPKPKLGLKPPPAKPEVNADQKGNPGPNGTEPLGWVSKKDGGAIQTEESSKFEGSTVSVPVAGMLPEKKDGTGNRPEPVLSNFKSNLPASSDPADTPAGELGKMTQGGPDAAGSVEPVTGAKATQAAVQPETKTENRFNSAAFAKPSQKDKDAKLSLGPTASKLPAPLRQSGASEESKLPLTKEKAPTPSPTAMLPSASKEIKPQANFVTTKELAATQKENPKPANREPPITALNTGSKPEEPSAEALKQELALARNDEIKHLPESKSLVRPVPKALEGYIIQVAFKDRSEARRWGDIFQQRGYAVSTTESGTAESLRVRIGNFSIRDAAERELKNIRKDGLTGIILNLPQAYRPEVHSSLP